MDFFEFVISLVAVGGTFVTIWVIALSRRRDKPRPAAEAQDTEFDLQSLSTLARSMHERIETLEAILDAEVPGWRDNHESSQK